MPDTDIGEPIDEPIVVPDNAIQQMLWVVVRYALAAIAGSSFVKGALGADAASFLTSDDTVKWVAGGVATLGLMVWGALKSRKNVAVQQALADKLPNEVAHRASEAPKP